MKSLGYLNALTSLRFFAATLVAIGHMGQFPAFSYLNQELISFSQGVTFFFVLSGFILSHAYGSKNTPFSHFIVNRIARIWPVHLFLLIVTLLLISTNLMSTLHWNWLELFLNAFLFQSLVPFPEYYFSFNWVSWSISTELLFYIAFPVLLLATRRSLVLTALTSVLFLLTVLIFTSLYNAPIGLVGTHPITRVFEFTVGVLTYKAYNQIHFRSGTGTELVALSLCLVAMAFCTTFRGEGVFPFWFKFAGPAIPMALLIAVIAKEEGLLSKFLSHPFMVYMGKISFSIYMVHQIIMRIYSTNQLSTRYQILDAALVILVIVLTAVAIFEFVEEPARHLIRKFYITRYQTVTAVHSF